VELELDEVEALTIERGREDPKREESGRGTKPLIAEVSIFKMIKSLSVCILYHDIVIILYERNRKRKNLLSTIYDNLFFS